MNTDIRVAIILPRHWKYKKLKRLLGCSPMEYLIVFWGTVAEQIPTGDLKGWSEDDVEQAAEWDGEPGLFFSSMMESGLLDKTEHGFTPHDWEENQPWAIGAKARSEAASKAGKASADARKRSIKNKEFERNANGMLTERSTGVLNGSSTPSPFPSPSPKSKEEQISKNDICLSSAKPPTCPHDKIIWLYHDLLPELPKVRSWEKTNRSNLQARWREDKARQKLEWWEEFFRYIGQSSFLMGKVNDFRATLPWIVGPKNFSKIINGQYEGNAQKTGSKRTDDNIRAAETFLREREDERKRGASVL